MEPDQAAAAVAVAGFVEKDELGEEVRNLFVQFVEQLRTCALLWRGFGARSR